MLLHVCCGPCLLYPAQILTGEGREFTCYFFNPNIHPYRECKNRLNSFKELADSRKYPYIIDRDYGLRDFLRRVVFKEEQRCRFCYQMRFEKTAKVASENLHSVFSTTLLFSIYQNHELLKKQAQAAAEAHLVAFAYFDFREGWQQGRAEAISANLYRQSYCGCIYSEQERYDNRLKKQMRKERK